MKEPSYHIDDAMLVKYLLGESGADESREVEQWIEADSNNQKYYNDFKLIWEESTRYAAISTIDEDASWQRFRNRMYKPAATPAPVISIRKFSWLKVAAMIFIIAGVGVIGYSLFNSSEPGTLFVQSQNNILIDTLPDGSVITLNKHSNLSYPGKFEGNNRSIHLEGEAFFKVTPDKTKPFIIHVNDVTVRVIGTSFNIKSIDGNTEVIVESGIVQVIKNNKNIELHPSEKVLVRKDDSVLQKAIEKESLYNYYLTKEFECDNTPLWKLVEVLNEAYNVNIIIENNKLRDLPLTTTFNNESLDNILEIIRQTFNISIVKSGNSIILK